MLHGLTCNSAYWLRVVPLLDRLRVIALERVAVAGHSLGAYVALLAATRSDRLASVLAIDVKSDWTGSDAGPR